MTQVDVEQMLNEMAARASEKLNWRTFIVDLMKVLGLGSSLGARKGLAQGLHDTGDTNDNGSHERMASPAGHEQGGIQR